MGPASNSAQLQPLRGMQEGSVDKAGRLKVNAKMVAHLAAGGFTEFWVTTLDERTIRIYPMPEWIETEKMLMAAQGAQAAQAKSALFFSDYYGDDAKFDSSNRMTIPTTLRKKFGMEDISVSLRVNKGHIEVLTPQMLENRFTEARSNAAQAVDELEAMGMR